MIDVDSSKEAITALVEDAKLQERRIFIGMRSNLTVESATEYWKERVTDHAAWKLNPATEKYERKPKYDVCETVALHLLNARVVGMLHEDPELRTIGDLEEAFAIGRLMRCKKAMVPKGFQIGPTDMYALARQVASHGEEQAEVIDALFKNLACYEHDPRLRDPYQQRYIKRLATEALGFGSITPPILQMRTVASILSSASQDEQTQPDLSKLFAARIIDRFVPEKPEVDTGTAAELLAFMPYALTEPVKDLALDVFQAEALPTYIKSLNSNNKSLNFSPAINVMLVENIKLAAQYIGSAQRVYEFFSNVVNNQRGYNYHPQTPSFGMLLFDPLFDVAQKLVSEYNAKIEDPESKLEFRPAKEGVDGPYADAVRMIDLVIGAELRARVTDEQASAYERESKRLNRLLESQESYMKAKLQHPKKEIGKTAMRQGTLTEVRDHHEPDQVQRTRLHYPGKGLLS